MVRFGKEEIRYGTKTSQVNSEVKTYQMSEEERIERMKVTPVRYIELKEKGLTDHKAAKEMGISQGKLNLKKSEWEFTHLTVPEMKKKVRSKGNNYQWHKTGGAKKMGQQIGEEVHEKEAEEAHHLPTNKAGTSQKVQDLEEALKLAMEQNERLRESAKETTREMERLEAEMEERSLKTQKISEEYETVQGNFEDLQRQFDALQEETYHPKTSALLAEQELKKEQEAHRWTKGELETAHREIMAKKNQIEILTQNNERLNQRLHTEQETHHLLASYTKRVMPL